MRSCRLVVLTLALLACGGNDADADANASADSGAAAAAPTSEVVQATLREWTIELSVDTVTSGPVSVQIANRGEYGHSFEMQGEGETWTVENIASGEDATLRVDLVQGIYDIYCPFEDTAGTHESRGMRAQLVVRPARD